MTRPTLNPGQYFTRQPTFERLVAALQSGQRVTPKQAGEIMCIGWCAAYKRLRWLRDRSRIYVAGWEEPSERRGPWVPQYAWRDAGQTHAPHPLRSRRRAML